MKPFCYYCDKEFKNEAILLKHLKNRHFGCRDCRKKFSTAQSLQNHLLTRHRKTLDKVYNAKKGRESILLKIYIMDGIPEEIIDQRIHLKTVQLAQKLENDLKKIGINVDE